MTSHHVSLDLPARQQVPEKSPPSPDNTVATLPQTSFTATCASPLQVPSLHIELPVLTMDENIDQSPPRQTDRLIKELDIDTDEDEASIFDDEASTTALWEFVSDAGDSDSMSEFVTDSSGSESETDNDSTYRSSSSFRRLAGTLKAAVRTQVQEIVKPAMKKTAVQTKIQEVTEPATKKAVVRTKVEEIAKPALKKVVTAAKVMTKGLSKPFASYFGPPISQEELLERNRLERIAQERVIKELEERREAQRLQKEVEVRERAKLRKRKSRKCKYAREIEEGLRHPDGALKPVKVRACSDCGDNLTLMYMGSIRESRRCGLMTILTSHSIHARTSRRVLVPIARSSVRESTRQTRVEGRQPPTMWIRRRSESAG